MPGGGRTGPLGYGPMTGRSAGYCAGYGAPGYVNAGSGRGGGFGRGRGYGGGGRGWRHMFCATGQPRWGRGYAPGWTGYAAPEYYGEYTPERELDSLKEQTDFFRKQIDVLNGRIRELEEIAAKKRDTGA